MRYKPETFSSLEIPIMPLRPFAAIVTLISATLCVIGGPANAQDSNNVGALADNAPSAISIELDGLHDDCLDLVAQDAELGYEHGLTWKGDGGGRRAHHCIAMALFALGHRDEAAYRLEILAGEAFVGPPQVRGDLYAQSADFWLAAGENSRAYEVASKGLDIAKDNIDLRLARARAYAQLERWDYAEIDLTSALAFHPGHESALRYRADARRRLGKFDEALRDIEQAMRINPVSVENALVRGQINEDMRLDALNSEQGG